ncbi:hypothetical protein ACFLXF_02275 [Chloroflexota bacterium]
MERWGIQLINVTEKAKKELQKLLDTKADWPGAILRLIDRGQGKLGLGIDIEAQGDIVVEHEGNKLLVVEPGLAGSIKGITLDVDDSSEGETLVILEGS